MTIVEEHFYIFKKMHSNLNQPVNNSSYVSEAEGTVQVQPTRNLQHNQRGSDSSPQVY